MILYLKVPECIQKQPDPSELGGGVDINHASGVVDGYTYFNWGQNVMRDVVALRPVTEEYVKPERNFDYLPKLVETFSQSILW